MNWQALFTAILNLLEKNPGLVENLLTALFTLLTNNPSLLNEAVSVGLAHAKAALPTPPTA
jgi:hypothetical protein